MGHILASATSSGALTRKFCKLPFRYDLVFIFVSS